MSSTARAGRGGEKAAAERYARTWAAWLLGQWRRQGFNALVCLPAGVCARVFSSLEAADLPEGYCLYPIDSEQALAALSGSMQAGPVSHP